MNFELDNTFNINLQYFNTLLEHSIVSKSDLEGNIIYINENFVKALGYSKKELIGKNHNILRHPETSSEIFKDLWQTIKSRKVFRERVLSKKKDGSDFWAETTIIPLVDNKTNEVIEYIAIRDDITEFLHMKRAIHYKKIKEEEREKISKAKDSFLILFTHELKTPLNAIMNFSKYLYGHMEKGTINKVLIEKQIKLLKEIEKSASMMLEEIVQLLELSKLKSNKLTYNVKSFDLCDTLKDITNQYKIFAKNHNTQIDVEYCNKNCFINSDDHRISQIISNILSNAIKYSKGIVHMNFKCDDKYFEICVEDNGPGIQNKEKAMELFEQTEGDVKTRHQKGTGIGLNFVKLLCNDLQIDYKLEDSKDLGGLSFTISKKL